MGLGPAPIALPAPPPPEAPPVLFRNHPGLPRHNTSSSSVPRPDASTTRMSVARTDRDTGPVPPELPAPGKGCASSTAAASILQASGLLVISGCSAIDHIFLTTHVVMHR
jgi:hypothetical protein